MYIPQIFVPSHQKGTLLMHERIWTLAEAEPENGLSGRHKSFVCIVINHVLTRLWSVGWIHSSVHEPFWYKYYRGSRWGCFCNFMYLIWRYLRIKNETLVLHKNSPAEPVKHFWTSQRSLTISLKPVLTHPQTFNTINWKCFEFISRTSRSPRRERRGEAYTVCPLWY